MQSRCKPNWSKVLVCCTGPREQPLHSSPQCSRHSCAGHLSHIDPSSLPTDRASSRRRLPPCKPPCALAPCQGTGWQPPLSKSLHHLNTASESEISSLQNSTAAVISVRRCKSKSLKLSINRTSCWEQLLTGASVQDMLLQLQSVVLNYEPYSSTCPIHRLY